MNTLKKDWPIVILTLVPISYLFFIWPDLSESVPVHWNIDGVADRYGSKTELAIMVLSIPIVTYLLFLIVPLIDPKKKVEEMGAKFSRLKWLIVGFMVVISMYIIYTASTDMATEPKWLFLIIGALIAVMGNFFQTIRSNYFIGVRTPWTLENEEVWRLTHLLAGKIWFISGIVLTLLTFLLDSRQLFISTMLITAFIVIVPVVHSYMKYNELQKS